MLAPPMPPTKSQSAAATALVPPAKAESASDVNIVDSAPGPIACSDTVAASKSGVTAPRPAPYAASATETHKTTTVLPSQHPQREPEHEAAKDADDGRKPRDQWHRNGGLALDHPRGVHRRDFQHPHRGALESHLRKREARRQAGRDEGRKPRVQPRDEDQAEISEA